VWESILPSNGENDDDDDDLELCAVFFSSANFSILATKKK
jgi:hypothetical protein